MKLRHVAPAASVSWSRPYLRHFTSFEMPAQASMKVLLATKSDEVTFARELSMLAAVKVYKRGALCAG
jgi:hypothetical protein